MSELSSALPALNDASLLRTAGLIDGEWVPGANPLPVHDPASGAWLAEVSGHGPEQAQAAIAAAEKALPAWRARSARDRGLMLARWAQQLRQHSGDLAALMTAEQGKPLAEAAARWPTPLPSWTGTPKRASASTARPFPATDAEQALLGLEAAGRRLRRHHALELSRSPC
jgi:hypothetical protein